MQIGGNMENNCFKDGIMLQLFIPNYELEKVSTAEILKSLIELRIEEARQKIYHEIGLDDGTYELSRDIE